MSVEVRGLHRRFGSSAAALDGVDLSIASGEFVALLGPSGSGKTTLLRILAGLDFPDAGEVRIEGRDVARVPARERNIGFVFQHYALFRHMSVFENVAFGLRVRPRQLRPNEAEIGRRVQRLLELVQIGELAKRLPEQLSGGQRQRVALARALATEPRLLLLDEPFGALDARVRRDLRGWLRGLHEGLGITSIFVTHDQDEAMEMADRVALLRAGRVVQFATPKALLAHPADAFAASFLGEATELACTVRNGRVLLPGLPPLGVPLPDGPALLVLRPHDLRAEAASGGLAVRSLRPSGAGLRLTLELPDGALLQAESADAGLARGDAVALTLLRPPLIFPRGGGAGIAAHALHAAEVR